MSSEPPGASAVVRAIAANAVVTLSSIWNWNESLKIAMYVCLCKGITDDHIRDAICGGATTLRQVRKQLGAMTQCGKCALHTKEILEKTLGQQNPLAAKPLFYSIA